MKNINHIFIIPPLLFLAQILGAQTIYNFDDKDYMVDNYGYKFNQLDPFFEKDEVLYSKYSKARKNYKAFKTSRTVFLGSLFLGFTATIMGNGSSNCDGLCLSGLQQGGLLTLLIVAPLSGLSSLILGPKSKRDRRNLIDQYNDLFGDKISLSKTETRYTLTGSAYGLSLVVRF